MGTQSSANLEKAYEDLEREIRDIKNKLQRSMGGGGSSTYLNNNYGPQTQSYGHGYQPNNIIMPH